jgi:2-polyprenyl-3-methyl-5-hydroxy-6-metoxy-1,4-benzoquinol methylase
MDIETIRAEREQIIARYGPWTAHNIRLADDCYTISATDFVDEFKQRRMLQIVSDITNQPFADLRVLDLACLEGAYAIEFALHGATVVGIEGRENNIARARFAQEALGLDHLTLVQGDVRDLSREKNGTFDVVLCIGILYHLDAPDVFRFVERIAEVCTRVAIFDTHISTTGDVRTEYDGATYAGEKYVEHAPDATDDDRVKKVWASLSDPESFWLTRPSLYNLLAKAGFTSVYECHNPAEALRPSDRITLVAMRGERHAVRSAPRINSVPDERWPEAELPPSPITDENTAPAEIPPAPSTRDASPLPARILRALRRTVADWRSKRL